MWPKKLSPAPILGSIHGQRAHGEGKEAFPRKNHVQLCQWKSCILGFLMRHHGAASPFGPFPQYEDLQKLQSPIYLRLGRAARAVADLVHEEECERRKKLRFGWVPNFHTGFRLSEQKQPDYQIQHYKNTIINYRWLKYLQGDTSGWWKPSVDIDLRVACFSTMRSLIIASWYRRV